MPVVSLRSRLSLLVLLALLPGLALLVWSHRTLSDDEVEEADQRVRVLAQLVAESQAARDEGARQMLLGVVRAVGQLAPGSDECDGYLRDFGVETAAAYVNFGILSLDGSTVCASSANTGRGVDVSQRAFFQRAVATQQFTIGELIRGENSGRELVNYLQPIVEDGRLSGFAIASLNLDRLQASLASVPLPLDAAVALLDRTGAVIARTPSDNWIPERVDPARLDALGEAAQPVLVFDGPDGVERHYGFVWVGGRRDMLAVAGVRADVVLAEVDRSSLTALVLLLFWGGGLAALVFVVADQQLRRPLEHLLVAVRRLGSGDATARAEVDQANSLGFDEMGEAFNRMAESLSRREQHDRDSQRLEAIGQIAGGLAHDFNNLLTVIIGFGHSLEADVHREAGRENLRQVLAAAERASVLTRELLAFARRQELLPEPIQLSERVSAVAPMLQRIAGERIATAFVLDPRPGVVRADPAQVEQILLNLILNARDAMPQGGRITVETRPVALSAREAAALGPVGNVAVPSGDYVALEVSDTGEGISPEVRARIFEPFFTTKGAKGSGLGLATVYGIVAQSGGYLFCESERGEGTTFRILLPKIDEAPAIGSGVPEGAEMETSGSEVVLIVEDEPSVRVLAERILQGAGYRTSAADSAAAALARLRDGLRPDLVLTDVMMPRMNGVALAESLRASMPGVRVLYMSGHVEHEILKAGKIDRSAFLRKPFTPDALLRAVRHVLDRHEPA